MGVFILDPSVVIPNERDKEAHIPANGIEFKRSSSHAVDDELIEYIKAHTGKMKSLAVADLESYVTIGTELLNIGKPFYLEGIGTLTKNKEGNLEFTPGEYGVVRPEEQETERKERVHKKKPVQEEVAYEQSGENNGPRKIIIALAILAGLSVIAWGGYLMYRKNAAPANIQPPSVVTVDTTATKADSVNLATRQGAASGTGTVSPGKDSLLYKFIILRTHDKSRALRRYNQLLSYDLKPMLETKDSSFFKVYFSFPAVNKDTVRIKDSLLRVYAHPVTIER